MHKYSPIYWWSMYIIIVPYVGGLGTELLSFTLVDSVPNNILLVDLMLVQNYRTLIRWWTRYRIIVPDG